MYNIMHFPQTVTKSSFILCQNDAATAKKTHEKEEAEKRE